MYTLAILRKLDAQNTRDGRSPISTLSNILIVSQREHKLIKRLCYFTDIKPLFRGVRRERESRDRRRNNMESLYPLTRRIRQWSQNFTDFIEMSRPSVNKNQRNRVFSWGRPMHEMHFQSIEPINSNWQCKLRKSIQFSFMYTPIVVVKPMVYKTFHFIDWSAVYPALAFAEGGEGPSQATFWSWSGKRASRSFSWVCFRRESEMLIVNGLGCWKDMAEKAD